MPAASFTAFPSTEENLRALVRDVDTQRLAAETVAPCHFSSNPCGGMCCSLKVAVTREEAEVLTRLVKEKDEELQKMGLRLRSPVVIFDAKARRRFLAKRRRKFSQLNKIVYNLIRGEKGLFPFKPAAFSRFLRTCVFSLDDGACALQRLSEGAGLNKWHYKPINCWKFPLSIENKKLTLPQKTGGTPFPCDKNTGVPIYEGLKEELDLLGKILNRDILRQIRP